MAHQTGYNTTVVYEAESAFDTPASGAGGFVFRANASPGMKLDRALIESGEIRSDGKPQATRLGSKSLAATYEADLSVGTFDPLLEAITRGTWQAAVAITQTAMTSVTTGTNTIVAAAGSWITQGVRVGDIIRGTGFPDAGNNGRNLRVTGVVTLTITVAETLVVNASPDSSFTITILKKLIMGTTPVRRSFTFEEQQGDLTFSKQGSGLRVSSLRLVGQPNGMAKITLGLVGADMVSAVSPIFTTPTLTTSIGLTWLDAAVRVNGVDRVNLTAFDMLFDIGAEGLPVIGSNKTPDVFEDRAKVNGSFSSTLTNDSDLTTFTGETEFEFQAGLVEPDSEPKDGIWLFMPRLKYTGHDDSGVGQKGAKIVTLPWYAATKGAGVTGYDDSPLSILTSAA